MLSISCRREFPSPLNFLSCRVGSSSTSRTGLKRLIRCSYVIGRSLIANSAEELFDGTNAVVLSFLTGQPDPDIPPEPSMLVHIDDVSLAHVLALDKDKVPATAGVGNYLMAQSKPLSSTPLEVHGLHRIQ